MRFKPSEALRFLGGLAATVVVLGLIALRVTSCAPAHAPPPKPVPSAAPGATPTPGPPPAPPPAVSVTACNTGSPAAALANAASLQTLVWTPFGRTETGWETYVPLIAREIHTACPPQTPGFADALSDWERAQALVGDGTFTGEVFDRMNVVILLRRPFVRLSAQKICPAAPVESTLALASPGESFGGKAIELRPAALAAYRRMVAAARADDPRIAADPNNLTIFSGFRGPAPDAARCAAEHNCNGLIRATCSAHRTGLALDLYVGQAPGFGPDSSADANRLFVSKTPAYRWLVAHADRFGFVPYPFEPWHWEWTGEAP